MTTRVSALIALAATVAISAACGFDHKSSSPAAPSSTGASTTSTSTSSYVGTWESSTSTSGGSTPTVPTSCNSFQWHVTNQTSTSISGDFWAICGAYSVSGTGNGQLSGQTVTVGVSGSGTATGSPACAFSLSGTGTLDGDTLTIPYTGTTCFGPVHGTEVLRRATSPSVTINPPTLVSPINGAAASSTQPTLVLADSTRSGPAGAISYVFQVATDQGFQAIVASGKVAEATTQTQYTVPNALAAGTVFCWRAQATDGSNTSSWSSVQTFATPAATPSQPGFDLSQAVIVVGPQNFASWPQTSTITNLQVDGSTVCIYHTMLGRWPTVPFFGDPNTLVEGNQWYFALINGRWYAGAGEWVRPGQACKGFGGGPSEFYDPNQEPLHSWVPRPGDQVGFADSTPARAWPNMSTLDQRTDVQFVVWQW